ncbi:hypothetical protein [Ilumatobacter sp.]|uniref:hypothetical protein n=1 Tax=Ilumatobacter sp. TaxID=1967498 RepID=UPI003B5298DE
MTTSSIKPAVFAAVVAASHAYLDIGPHLRALYDRLSDDSGVEDAPSKLIYLGVAVAVAIAAGLFIIQQFNDARDSVPDPIAPTP